MKKQFAIYDVTGGCHSCVASIRAYNGKTALHIYVRKNSIESLWEYSRAPDDSWEAYSTYGKRLMAKPAFNPDLA